jgi:hypothetical protein
MFTNPHNQNLLNDVMRVLSGETTETPIKPVPQWISEAAVTTAAAIKEISKENVMTLEIQRDILRKHLSEAIADCDCQVNADVPIQFEEEVRKALEEKAVAPVVSGKPVSIPSHKANELATPKDVVAKTKAPATKSMPKNTGLASTGKNPTKIGEQVESELREFLTQLTMEEIATLRNIINETH